MEDHQNWLVTVDPQVDIARVSRVLSQSGFQVKQILSEVSCITGSAPGGKIPLFRKITGVVNISADFPVDLGPGDGDIQ
jgi:hypothetical protein